MNGGAESMNIPNMISMVRILLTPVFAVLYVRGALWQAMGVLLLCAVSDVLDGPPLQYGDRSRQGARPGGG